MTYLIVAIYLVLMPTFIWGYCKIRALLVESRSLRTLLVQIQRCALGVVVWLTVLVVCAGGYGVAGGAKACTPYSSIGGQLGVVVWVSSACAIHVVLRYAALAVVRKVRGSKSSSTPGGRAGLVAHAEDTGHGGSAKSPMASSVAGPSKRPSTTVGSTVGV